MASSQLEFENGLGISQTRIDDIPDDLMIFILQKLDQYETPKKLNFKAISRVSKRWYVLANLSRVSLTISGFKVRSEANKGSKMTSVLTRFCNLSSLNLGFLFDCNEDVLSVVGYHCPNLKEIQIPDSYKSDNGGKGLISIANGCSKLEVLSLHAFKGLESSLISIGHGCPMLKSLRLRSAASLNDTVVQEIVKNCRRIEDLDISFTSVTDTALVAIGENLRKLTQLDLKHNKKITGQGIARVAQGCPLLRVLHLGVVNVGDEGLMAIGGHSKNLEELYLDYGSAQWGMFNQDSISAIAGGCRKLKLLSFRGSKQINDGGLHGFMKTFPSLVDLDLHACQNVSDNGLSYVIKGCKQVQNLTLTGTTVGGTELSSFKGGLFHLKSLRLNNDAITDLVLKSISENCVNLEELFLANCSRVGDIGVQSLLKGCKNLKHLTIKSSTLVSGAAFCMDCPELETLILPFCGITDEGLGLIATHCKALLHLCISGCLKTTSSGLLNFISNASVLKELVLVGCSQLSKEQVISIAKTSKPSLKVMRVSRPGSPEDEYTIKRLHGGWVLPNWARH